MPVNLPALFLQPKAGLTAEDLLTPAQKVGLQYSRDRYNDGTYQANPGPDPSVTSFMGAISPAPGGSYMNYPTFWADPGAARGRVLMGPGDKIDFDEAQRRALAWEAQTGQRFARYASPLSADAGESLVHQVMDADAERVLATPEAQARLRGGR